MFNKKLKEKIEQLKDKCEYLEDRCRCLDRNCEDLAMGEYRVNIANIQLQQEIKQLKEERNELTDPAWVVWLDKKIMEDAGPTPEEDKCLPSSDECDHVYGSYVDCVNDELTKFRFNFCPRCGEVLGEEE